MADEPKPFIRRIVRGGENIGGMTYLSPDSETRQKAAKWMEQNPGVHSNPNPSQWDYYHNRDEPDDTNAYARGGMVKHGSSTRVSCKSKG